MITKIILGTAQFGLNYGINNTSGKPSSESVFSTLEEAFSQGIRVLDTADVYGDAQEQIGDFHGSKGLRFKIVTKRDSSGSSLEPTDLLKSIEHSLQIMKIDELYGYMFHTFSDFKHSISQLESALLELVQSKRVQKIGVSVYTSAEVLEALEYDIIDLIQLPFNLLDNWNLRSNVIQKAKHKGVEIQTRSVYLQGLFFQNPASIPAELVGLGSHLEEIHEIAHDNNSSINALALRYVVHQSDIDAVLIGVDNRTQLVENLQALSDRLPSDIIQRIDNIVVKEVGLLDPSTWNFTN